jgi:hypothetical protein
MIIILESDKISEDVRNKLLKKGLSLIGMSNNEIIFKKLKQGFNKTAILNENSLHSCGPLFKSYGNHLPEMS